MHSPIQFSVEMIDGYRLGKLGIPLSQIADWLNFLVAPQYRADIISAEQTRDRVDIYFQASEGLYLYLDMRLSQTPELAIVR
ncbi:MAG: hypothetical protein ACFE0I_11385 [Elainellaceae cyanobacterium]